jgi:hypothetical protein
MPYKIRKLPLQNLYRVYNADTGEIHAKATSLENAKKQVKLLYMIENNVPLESQGMQMTNMKIGSSIQTNKKQELNKYSDINRVMMNAKRYFKNEDFTIAISTRKTKKFMILNPQTNKWVHFGQMGMQDATRHQDDERRLRYIKRASKLPGNWKADKYSPNNLSLWILWGA